LPVDVVIVDEASMVDLALMAKLFDAVPLDARVVLVGDKDQLASVEAGYVLGDICGRASASATAPIGRHIVELKTNYRFGAESAISRLSEAVNGGRADDAVALLQSAAIAPELPIGIAPEILPGTLPKPAGLVARLEPRILAGYRAYLEANSPAEALQLLNGFRVLCALRRGPFGVENLNSRTEEILTNARLIDPSTPFYAGRPIVILRNDYQLKLFNGDIGIFLRDIEAKGDLRAFFLGSDGFLRRVLPARLPAHETAFAMTVHKSQGSEFGRVLLILPDQDSPVVTRELVYTGLTRAKRQVELWYSEPQLRVAIARRTERTSGLRDALWSTPV
jgi:exodeoxyribonuclease V alpha subunit